MGSSGTRPETEEGYRQTEHWDSGAELVIVTPGTAGALNLGAAVAAARTRRVREITARFTGTVNIVVTVRVNATIRLSFDLSAQATRVWSSQDGRKFLAGEQPQVYADLLTGGTLYVTAGGIER